MTLAATQAEPHSAVAESADLRPRRGWLPVVTMLLVTAAGSLIPLLRTPGFYFWDDTEAVAVGVWQRIAADILTGQNPFLQPDMWRGGNFIAEAATGLWNPVMVALMLATHPLDDVAAAITIAKIAMFLMAAGGVYALARSYRATPWLAAAAGTTLALSGWAIFMDGTSWINGSAITAFTPWAWWGLRRAYRSGFRPWPIVLAVVLCYLVPSTGNPYGFLTLAIVFLAICVEAIVDRRARDIWWLVALGAGVVLTVVVVYLPFVFTSAYGVRAGSGIGNDEFLSPSLNDLLGMSSPSQHPYIKMFGNNPMGFPGTYLGWFVLPLLPWLRWRGRAVWQGLAGPAVFAGFFLLVALGPSQLGMFRWPARLVPFFFLGLIVIFAALASRGLARDRVRLRSLLSLVIILAGAWTAFSDVPKAWKWHGLMTVAVIVGIWLLVRRTGLDARGFAVIAVGSLLFMGGQVMMTPSNQNVADYQMPTSRSAMQAQFADRVGGTTVQVFDVQQLVGQHPASLRWKDLLVGNMPSVAGYESTTAYTGIGFTKFDNALCMTYNGGSCAGLWDVLWKDPKGFDTPLADLLRADYVVVLNDYADNGAAPSGWSITKHTSVATTYTRDDKVGSAAGTVSYVGDGASVHGDALVGSTGERMNVQTTSGDTRLVLARIAWPGYSASLDGKQIPVTMGPAGLVELTLPQNLTGTLTLSFTPPGLWLGAAAGALGVAICAACVVVAARRRRRTVA